KVLAALEENKNLSQKPLAEYTLEDHFRQGEHILKGMHLLLSWRELVGHQNFQAFVKSNDAIAKVRGLTDNDIKENMLKFTSGPYQVEVSAMYDAAVFGK
ncbi:hypothetical protein HYV85_00620, partial [Candidatus Woesearchaeota archaeon]|nr:hypothetical protein [Candidatus Woesearchaeota archaeon]